MPPLKVKKKPTEGKKDYAVVHKGNVVSRAKTRKKAKKKKRSRKK